MKRSVNSLIGYTLHATDGEIGEVKEFYFDDQTSTIRYVIVKTGGWLLGKEVLISPQALEKPDWETKTFPVNLTKEQIKNSPDIDTDKPVSRQQEELLYAYYPWTGYYSPFGGWWGFPVVMETDAEKQLQSERHKNDDRHLRSTSEIKGYTIHAVDGKIGEVEDFIVDDDTWRILFLVVDTGNWLPGKKVLLSPQWIKEMRWSTSEIIVDLSKDEVKHSPEYDPSQPVNEAYEHMLSDYYGRPLHHYRES